jgi:hypothetical protein
MTKQQITNLEFILAKLESLQRAVANESVKDRLGVAKSELLTVLRRVDLVEGR